MRCSLVSYNVFQAIYFTKMLHILRRVVIVARYIYLGSSTTLVPHSSSKEIRMRECEFFETTTRTFKHLTLKIFKTHTHRKNVTV